jgi:hypothetical protein
VPSHVVIADFGGDGLLDVAVASATDHQVRVLLNRRRPTR